MLDESDPRPVPANRGTMIKAAVAVGVLVIFAAVLGPAALIRPTASPGNTTSPTGAPATGVPSTTAPEASAEPWADLTVEPYEATAALAADDQDRGGIATGTSFTLKSLTSTPAVELARGLKIDPPVQYSVEAGPTADVARVHPVKPLVAGVRYRVRVAAPDGALAGIWAFITRAPIHVVGTLPADQTTGVPTNTGIEVTFDQDGATGVAAHVTIEPAIAGRFEAHGRTWAYIADKPLAAATIYTVTVHKGVGLDGSSVTLQSDLTFRFETAQSGAHAARTEFRRTMIEIRPDAQPTVLVYEPSSEDETNDVPPTVHVQIHRLPDFASVTAAGVALASGFVGGRCASCNHLDKRPDQSGRSGRERDTVRCGRGDDHPGASRQGRLRRHDPAGRPTRAAADPGHEPVRLCHGRDVRHGRLGQRPGERHRRRWRHDLDRGWALAGDDWR
jgi:hypothetical protein